LKPDADADPAHRSPTRLRHGTFVAGLVGVALLASAVRLGALAAFPPTALIGDEAYYVHTAVSLAAGRGHARDGVVHASWPPAYSYWLSLFVDTEGGGTTMRRLLFAQAGLGTLVVLLTAMFARGLFDARTGLVAGVAASLYPTLVAFSQFLWSETLLLALLMAALTVAVGAERSRNWGLVALTGLLLGVASLTREIALPIAVVVAAWWLWTARDAGRVSRGRALRRGIVMLSVAVVVVLPWTVRNYRLFGRLVPVSSVGWMAMRQGNTFAADDWTRPPTERVRQFNRQYKQLPDEMKRMDLARRQTLELIQAEQPAWIWKKLARNSAMLLSPDSFLFKKISRGAYGELSTAAIRFALLAGALGYTIVFALGVVGIAARDRRGQRALSLGIGAVVYGLHVVALASPRYRLPLVPILIAYASHTVVSWRHLEFGRASRVVAGAVLAAFFLWCVPYFFGDAFSLWQNGTYLDPGRP